MSFGRTHGAPYRGYGYVPLRFRGGDVVRRMGTQQQQQQVNERKDKLDGGVSQVAAQFVTVTLNSEMDFYLRNGRNGDFFTKWSYKFQFHSLSGKCFI